MYFETQEINPHKGDAGKFGIISSIHDRLSFRDPVLNSELTEYSNNVMICFRPDRIITAPPIILVGEESGTAQLLGKEWAKKAPFIKSSGNQDLEEFAASGYRAAHYNGYYCDMVYTELEGDQGLEKVTYIRYIRTLKTSGGVRLFVVAGGVLDRAQQFSWQ